MANPITHEATDWKPLESGGTEITAARLNNIDGDVTKLANALGAALQVLSAGQDAATVEVPYRPCWLWDPAGRAMTFVAEDGSRTQPLASAADLKSVRDSVSQRVRTTGNVTDSYLSADATLATPQRVKITVATSDGNQYLAVFADTYLGLYDVVGKRWVWQMRP